MKLNLKVVGLLKMIVLAIASWIPELILALYGLLILGLAVFKMIDENEIMLMAVFGLLFAAGPMRWIGKWIEVKFIQAARETLPPEEIARS
ncbi:hypothetical protein HQ524_00395 [Candidatus Uhrbacteria bacterium]|nr:hypothetical protein [Candidatus Uhrbacteria bacterium]